jgi:hypothetical protein
VKVQYELDGVTSDRPTSHQHCIPATAQQACTLALQQCKCTEQLSILKTNNRPNMSCGVPVFTHKQT